MLQNELDYIGSDFSVNLKAINPDPQDFSGIYTVSYLQSVSETVAVGGECISQKGAGESMETGFNLVARWAAPAVPVEAADSALEAAAPKLASPAVATLTIQQLVACQLSYFYRVSDKIELGAELQTLLVGPRKDAITSVSAKFDYRQACIRTQLDSQGKVSLMYEEKLFPGFALLLSGELDHLRGSSRFGLGINLEN